MPRTARIDAPGALHHIICRGIERGKIFEDNADRDDFIHRLSTILKQTSTSCYAWALIPNHFHLLLRTGKEPIATVMRRLLTGYAVSYNRRHRRSGHLFQNRYKSILCQEDSYLLELVRYLHLNPIRAGLVSSLKELDRFPYSGHSRLMGKVKNQWQDVDTVLSLFGKKRSTAQKKYREFVAKGIPEGKKPELTGGGLIRSVGGWGVLNSMRRMKVHFKSDERILGDSDFVDMVLQNAAEKMDRQYRLKAAGYDFDALVDRVSGLFRIEVKQLLSPSKQPERVMARSVLSYWAVRELGISGTAVGKRLGLSQSAVSKAVQRGERLVSERNLSLKAE
jgi:putative transposase